MELLVIVLNKEKYLEDILSILVELGATGATIIDSEGLGHFLAYEVPIFAGLRELMGERKTPSRTILALIEDRKFIAKLQNLLKGEGIDFTQPGTGVIFTIPVSNVIKPKGELPAE